MRYVSSMGEPSMNQAQAVSAQPTEPRRGGGTSLLWLLALPVLYVLSSGPMAKIEKTFNFQQNQPALDHALEIIYWPIAWCALQSPTFRGFLFWYWRDVWHVKMG
jgi:hypothetical protein